MSDEKLVGNIPIDGIKRCYVDMKIKHRCPTCEAELETDLSQSYLSNPEVGKECTVYFYCEYCEDEPARTFKVEAATITLSPV